MSSESDAEIAITCVGLGKAYQLYQRRTDRLKQVVLGSFHRFYTEYWALQSIDLTVRRGDRLL